MGTGPATTQFENCQNVCNAGVLFLLPALLSQGLLKGKDIYNGIIKGYYSLVHILLTLAFMALSRIKNPEQLKTYNPGEWGKILGLDRSPETKCVRTKIDNIVLMGKAREFNRVLSAEWIKDQECCFFYIDGHVRVYHGDKARLTKKYVSRQKLCLAGTTEYWVNDNLGNPFLVFTSDLNEKLKDVIKDQIIEELIRETTTPELEEALKKNPYKARFTIIFDREAYEPAFFKWLWETYRIAVITYRKYVKDKWDESLFFTIETQVINKLVTMQICEQGISLAGMWMREIRKLGESGHQTSIITTNMELTREYIAGRMFSRWSQENYFKYMHSDFEIDKIIQYGIEQINGEKKVVNPLYKLLTYEIKKLREKKLRLEARLFRIIDENLDNDIEQVKKQLERQSSLQEDINDYDLQIKCKISERKKENTHIKLKDMELKIKYNKLKTESKLFINTLKMVAVRAETALVNIIAPYYSRTQDEARMLIKEIIKKDADIKPDYQNSTLTITLHSMSTPHRNNVVKELCEILNDTETIYPDTNLRMIFKTVAL